MVDLLTNKSLSSKLFLSEGIKRKSKSSFGICKVHSSKQYPTIYTRKSVQISRNFLLNKMPIFFNLNNGQNSQNENSSPKQRGLYRFQSSKIMNNDYK